jgi:hypothetical protein
VDATRRLVLLHLLQEALHFSGCFDGVLSALSMQSLTTSMKFECEVVLDGVQPGADMKRPCQWG